MTDSLGDRMKSQYEDRFRVMLPRRTFTILRADGKAFHTLTRGRRKPYDFDVVYGMDRVLLDLCQEVQGCAFGYVQSDEVSLLLADFQTIHTDAWFDGNLQKMVSVAASVATRAFNHAVDFTNMANRATFDCRAFTITDPVEVENYFIWRQQDCTRNSVQSLAQAHFSPKELHGVSNAKAQDMLMTKGINWNDQPPGDKRGRVARHFTNTGWIIDQEPPVFTADRNYLIREIPIRVD